MRKLDLERETVLEALAASGGDVGRAAEVLGSSRRTLQSRMREFKIPPGTSGRRRKYLPYARRRRWRATSRRGWVAAAGVVVAGLATGVIVGARRHRVA